MHINIIFFPDAISKWNSLNSDTEKSLSIRQFQKSFHTNTISDTEVPRYVIHGEKVTNIMYTKLRHNCLLKH